MLIGLYVRGFKVYRGSLQYIPINYGGNFTAFLGDNGSGKSSILEALDTFFNKRERKINTWMKSKSYQSRIFISPLFLIEKSIVNQNIGEEFYKIMNSFSDIFKNNQKQEIREIIKTLSELYTLNDYYFFTIPNFYSNGVGKGIDFFSSDLEPVSDELIKKLYEFIIGYYKYIYFPVEIPVEEIVNFQSKHLESLINKNVFKEIDDALKQKVGTIGSKRTSQKPILDIINTNLGNFITEIESKIKVIDKDYSFSTGGERERNLQVADIREIILETYLYKRRLFKNGKQLSDLSSGEQRQALLDIIAAFLNIDDGLSKKIILAIDEPESSMHIKRCLSQFEKIHQLSTSNQVLCTTHWYGFLPTLDNGTLHYLIKDDNDDVDITSFNLGTYLENKKEFPDDIYLKSVFDLVSSIISTLKNDTNYNRIICEGFDDKIYLESYLSEINVKILPVGGVGNVKKIYEYLLTPLNDNKETKGISGKILCLMDSDAQKLPEIDSGNYSKNLVLRRLQIDNQNQKIQLKPLSDAGIYSETVIENALSPLFFYEAVNSVITQYGDQTIRDFFKGFEFNKDSRICHIKGDDSIFLPKDTNALKNKKKLIDRIDTTEVKKNIALEYKKLLNLDKIDPDWIIEIKNYFTPEKIS